MKKTLLLMLAMMLLVFRTATALTVSGYVRTSTGTAISGVSIQLDVTVVYRGQPGGGTETVTTNTAGYYSYGNTPPEPYYKGDNASVRIRPGKSGYTFSPAYKDFNNQALDAVVAQNFTGSNAVYYTITATTGSEATISPSGTIQVLQGGSRTFTMSVTEGYIPSLIVDDTSPTYTTSYTFTNVQANHTIHVYGGSFKTYICRILSGSNGTTVPSGNVQVPHGQGGTVEIIPDAGYRILDETLDGISVGSEPTFTITNVTSEHTFYASFTPITYVINASAGTGGTISPSGNTTVNHGGSQLYTITPSACYRIAGVTVDGTAQGAVSSYNFSNVSAGHTISAAFALNSYNITASAGTGGSISPTGVTAVPCGGSRGYTVTAATGYRIADVLVDGGSVGTVSSYTFSSVGATHTITASFTRLQYGITATAGTGVTVLPAGVTNVNHGSAQAYGIVPATGYEILDVTVDGTSQGVTDSYTFSNVTATHSIGASFGRLTYAVVATADSGGTIVPAGTTMVAYGDGQGYEVFPDSGFRILEVLVDGEAQGVIDTFTFTGIAQPHTIAATFAAEVIGDIRDAGVVTERGRPATPPYFTLQGVRVDGEPVRPGVYLRYDGESLVKTVVIE